MRSLIVTEFVTLDGVIDSPGGEPGHPHSGWTFQDVAFDPAAYEIKGREQAEAGALMMGRVSWEAFAPVWPTMAEFADYNAMPKYVVSSTLTDADLAEHPWEGTSIVADLAGVAALKEGDGGPISVHGSATLVQALVEADLVDRFHLLEFPVLLGAGKRLFSTTTGRKTRLSLVESASYANGVRLAVYDVVR